jgi:hypothetical protein
MPDNKAATAGLNYGVKYLCLISAIGQVADPIFVIASEKMSKEEYEVHEVSGLGLSIQGI